MARKHWTLLTTTTYNLLFSYNLTYYKVQSASYDRIIKYARKKTKFSDEFRINVQRVASQQRSMEIHFFRWKWLLNYWFLLIEELPLYQLHGHNIDRLSLSRIPASVNVLSQLQAVLHLTPRLYSSSLSFWRNLGVQVMENMNILVRWLKVQGLDDFCGKR